MADQENALQQVQHDISIKKSSGPTFIGDNPSVNVTVYHHHPPGAQNDQAYEQPVPYQVAKRIGYFDGRNAPNNPAFVDGGNPCNNPDCKCGQNVIIDPPVDEGTARQNKITTNPQSQSFMVFDLNEKKDEEQRFLDKVDEAIEKLPHTTTPLLEDLAKKICQTQSGFIRKECVKRMDNVLHWVTDTEHFSENTWGIYAADKIFRDFLISSLDPEKIKQCVSAYSGILTVMIKHSGPPKFKQDSLKQLLNELKEVVKPPQFCPYSRTRRDIEAVIKVMTNSVDNPKMLHNVGECIYKIEITKDGNQKNVIKLLNKYLKQKDWYQHFLIISWLKMQVFNRKKEIFLRVLLQVITYWSNKLRKRNQSYRWKFTLTVVESLTKIATDVPELSKMSVAGDKEKNIDGLIDFFQILWDRGMSDCLDIFYQYAKPLVYIDNMYIRRLLLTGIFKELDVTSEEFVKERLKKSQTMQYFTISETLHNGKNTLIMSGCFQSSQVVAKCYKFQREQLIMKYSFRRRKAANFANEAFMLSYLRKRECHSNIVQLIAYDEQLSCMVLKRVSQGCLLKFLRNRRTMYLSPKLMDLLHMIIQIADALVFLKKEKVFHLGIRAENVLLDENYHVKLTGFQSSRKSEEPVNLVEVENHHMKWMDPEGLSGKPVSHATDIWSFGVLMYEILTYGCVPYNNPTGNPDYDDFERKPMTSSQARLFVLRGGRLPKHPCIPEEIFQLISEKCCRDGHHARATVTELKEFLQKQYSNIQEKMENSPDIQPIPPPPKLRFLKEDVSPEDCNPGVNDMEDQEEDFPFIHLDVTDLAWNEVFPFCYEDLYNEDSYTNADPANSGPVLCNTRRYKQVNCPTNLVVLEYKEFRDIKHAEKLRSLNHPYLVNVLAVNRFGPVKLEMVSQSFPLGNVLSALLSTLDLRQHLVTYMIQAASAVVYLHDHRILHRDLRAENILLETEQQIKVGRLGLSKEEVDVNAPYMDLNDLTQQSHTANPRWNPTEVVEDGIYSKESDFWSFGIVCWELSKASNCPVGTRKEEVLPYNDLSDDEVYSWINLGGRLSNPDTSSDTLHNIYKDFWKKEPNRRSSISCVVEKLERVTIASVFDGSGSDNSSRSLGFDFQENSDAVKDEEDLYYTKEDLYECYEIYSASINLEQGRGTNNAQGNWECCSQECGEDSDAYKEIQCSYGEMTNTSYGTLYENVPCRGLENDQGHECYDDVTNKQSSGYQNNRDAQSSFYDTSHNNKTYEDKKTHLYENITIDHNSSYVKSLIDRWEARS